MEKGKVAQKDIAEFFASTAFAVVGVSANQKKFGNIVYRTMKDKGCTVFPVHTSLGNVEGDPCFDSVMSLPSEAQSIVTVVPPGATERVVDECVRKGVRHIWMQPGSESPRAIAAARDARIGVVHGECILMFLEPVESMHALHKWFKKMLRSLPS